MPSEIFVGVARVSDTTKVETFSGGFNYITILVKQVSSKRGKLQIQKNDI